MCCRGAPLHPRIYTALGFVAGIVQGCSKGHSFTASLECASKCNIWINGDFPVGGIEIKEH
jgi:hypothetical protein